MKVLLFTHEADIDGLGCCVLAKLAFDQVDFELCERNNLTYFLEKYFDQGKNYDRIFMTDICCDQTMLDKINQNPIWREKLMVFDHHLTEIKRGNDSYPFVHITIKNELGACSGTSLFYDYLITNGYLKDYPSYANFQELTRRYDTWEWKKIYHDERAHDLTLLFHSIGKNAYIDWMTKKLQQEKEIFSLTETEMLLVQEKRRQIQAKLCDYEKNIQVVSLLSHQVGFVFISYEDRNDLAEHLKEIDYPIDIIMMIALDHHSISLRNVKPDVSVLELAHTLGGDGHEFAASVPITQEQESQILKILIKK